MLCIKIALCSGLRKQKLVVRSRIPFSANLPCHCVEHNLHAFSWGCQKRIRLFHLIKQILVFPLSWARIIIRASSSCATQLIVNFTYVWLRDFPLSPSLSRINCWNRLAVDAQVLLSSNFIHSNDFQCLNPFAVSGKNLGIETQYFFAPFRFYHTQKKIFTKSLHVQFSDGGMSSVLLSSTIVPMKLMWKRTAKHGNRTKAKNRERAYAERENQNHCTLLLVLDVLRSEEFLLLSHKDFLWPNINKNEFLPVKILDKSMLWARFRNKFCKLNVRQERRPPIDDFYSLGWLSSKQTCASNYCDMMKEEVCETFKKHFTRRKSLSSDGSLVSAIRRVRSDASAERRPRADG